MSEHHEDRFREFAQSTSKVVGSPAAFFMATGVIVVWAVTGPLFHFSDTWQLVINTGTTIITFLMVFLIQTTQNRDAHALHLKLDELIRATKHARNRLLALEGMSDAELFDLEAEFQRLRVRPSVVSMMPAPSTTLVQAVSEAADNREASLAAHQTKAAP